MDMQGREEKAYSCEPPISRGWRGAGAQQLEGHSSSWSSRPQNPSCNRSPLLLVSSVSLILLVPFTLITLPELVPSLTILQISPMTVPSVSCQLTLSGSTQSLIF